MTNTMPPMVRRYRPVHKIYSAYQNLRKLKGPKHWYAGSNYFNNQASFNFRTNNYRRSKVSCLLKYFLGRSRLWHDVPGNNSQSTW
jgi:hypothetical protein